MKKFISVLVLVCVLASMFTLSAFAADDLKVGMMKITDEDDREAFGVFYTNPVYDLKDPKYIAENPLNFHIDLYSGTVKLAIAEPKLPPEYPDSNFDTDSSGHLIVDTNKSATSALFVLDGKDVSGSWKVNWLVLPTENLQPDNAKVYVDNLSGEGGFTSVTGSVTGLSSVTALIAVRDANGQPVLNGFVNTLEEAIAVAPSGATIEIRDAGSYTLPNTIPYPVTITTVDTANKDNTTITSEVPVANNKNLTFSNVTVVAPPPPAASSVPSTADNSNMPLWGGLFLAFAAVALLTGKKRRA